MWGFLSGPVVKTPCFHYRSMVWSLVLQATWHGQKIVTHMIMTKWDNTQLTGEPNSAGTVNKIVKRRSLWFMEKIWDELMVRLETYSFIHFSVKSGKVCHPGLHYVPHALKVSNKSSLEEWGRHVQGYIWKRMIKQK